MISAEFAILDWIQNTLRCGFLDKVLPVITSWSNHGEVWILLALVLMIWKKTRWLGIGVACGLLLDMICCNLVLKPLIGRVRPCDINTAVELLIFRPHDASFPSGHTAISFAAVGALAAAKSKLWIPACVLSVVIAFSRLYLYVHWPTDVLGGIVVGLLCGYAGCWVSGQIQKRLTNRAE